MSWLPNGDAQCDNCPTIRPCVSDRQMAIQMMRAGGWRHMQGKTLGDMDFETILCPPCTKDERRRKRANKPMVEDALPLNWEEGRIVVGKQGVSSR